MTEVDRTTEGRIAAAILVALSQKFLGGSAIRDAALREVADAGARAAVEAMNPRIETVDQLDALPDFAVVRDKVGTVWEKEHHASGEACWWQSGSDVARLPMEVRVPALLLYAPGAAVVVSPQPATEVWQVPSDDNPDEVVEINPSVVVAAPPQPVVGEP